MIASFLDPDHPTERDASKGSLKSSAIGTLSVQKRQEWYDELMENIRRLTVMVLDNLESGSRDNTLDQGQKRLLSSTGARLLRLWRVVLREGGSKEIAGDLDAIEGLVSNAGLTKREGASE